MKLLYLPLLVGVSFILSSCFFAGPREYSAEELEGRLSHDLSHPFQFSLPDGVTVEHGFTLGGRDRGDLFRLRASEETVREVKNFIESFFTLAKGYQVDTGRSATSAPFGAGVETFPDLEHLSDLDLTWWSPWSLQDAKDYYIMIDPMGPGLWFLLSESEGIIYLIAWST
jgi:hypothetical protein